MGDFLSVTSWHRADGYVITRSTYGDRYLMTSSGDLYVQESQKLDTEDMRKFKCQVEDQFNKRRSTTINFIKLMVLEPVQNQVPVVSYHSKKVVTEVGKLTHFVCLSEGFPVPSYRWYRKKEEKLLPITSATIEQLHGVLQFNAPEVLDTGNYVCMVFNEVGETQVTMKLIVRGNQLLTISPSFLRIESGHTASFYCNVTAMFNPMDTDDFGVEWRFNGRRITSSGRIKEATRYSLQINGVTRLDQGMYQCLVNEKSGWLQATAELHIGEQAPSLTSVFREQTIRPGNFISLKCVTSGDPLPTISWRLDGFWKLENGPRMRIRSFETQIPGELVSFLNVSLVEVRDSGAYECIASNYVGSTSHSARLNVYGSLFTRQTLTNMTALVGSTFELQCPFGGYPFDSVSWSLEGNRLPVSQRQVVHIQNGTLHIHGVDRNADQGRYQCTVQSGDKNHQVRHIITVTVKSGPQITPFNFLPNLQEGMRAGISCLVHSGDPPVDITWYKDGQLIPQHDTPEMAFLGSDDGFLSTLTLKKLTSKHNGNYTCRATNDYAYAEHSTQLVVKVVPKWRVEPRDTIAITGRSVSIDCQATGVPQPHIRWKSASEPKSDTSTAQYRTIISNSHIHILMNGTLTIRSVEARDAGLYLCEANNGVGSGVSRVIKLSVKSAPQFDSKQSRISAKRGSSAVLECKVKGDSPITFHWFKDGQPVDLGRHARYAQTMTDRLGNFSLSQVTVSSVERSDNAVFTCQASNDYGTDSTSVRLIVQDAPDAPTSLEVKELGSRQIQLLWKLPFSGNAAISQCTVQWRSDNGLWHDSATVGGDERQATIRGLKPTTKYWFKVRCQNMFGVSEFSNEYEIVTSEEPPRMPPQTVKLQALNTHAISISFDTPHGTEDEGKVEGYYIGYRIAALDQNTNPQYNFKTFSLLPEYLKPRVTFELDGLRKNTEYTIHVQPFNAKGAGPSSANFKVKTLEFDPPNPPKVTVTSTTSKSITISWEDAERSNQPEAGPIRGYYIYYRADNEEWHEVAITGERRSFTLTELRCGTQYHIYMRASNSAGKGPEGSTISTRTNGGRATLPEEQLLLATNSTSVQLHLDAWGHNGCPISYFVVQYKEEGKRDWILYSNNVLMPQAGQHLSSQVTIGELQPGSWYNLLMSAHNDAGETQVELSFATLTLNGELPPRRSEVRGVVSPGVYTHLTITLPILSCIVVIAALCAAVCFIAKKKAFHETASGEADLSNCRNRNFMLRTSCHRTYWNLVEVFDGAAGQRHSGPCQDGQPVDVRGAHFEATAARISSPASLSAFAQPPTPSPRGTRRLSTALEESQQRATIAGAATTATGPGATATTSAATAATTAAAAAANTARHPVQSSAPADATSVHAGGYVLHAQVDSTSPSTRWVRADQLATHL
ncbi:Down syndrome cell adhesion molecule-like isoform X5 [Varroa destructor]|uniref:Down syndrome cell adhesion molecule-like protein Dscam2 n=1 Tax=Varroa destructor TaxID=109461 RepID=A0A7M7JI25_VARDE|nr:Down syndrome cell adhesion molecule-like isoform X5 [Varroa destructor]